ncbi:MAG: hypothetical protein ABL955_10520 [Elusimicrobiota bacterium]
MKIEYDSAEAYTHPLSKTDVQLLRPLIVDSVMEKIAHIRFGCNQKTTQEGRTVQRGPKFDIRVNFCVKSNQGLLLSTKSDYTKIIIRCGGKLDLKNNVVTWTSAGAKLYAAFLLLHEIGHIVHCDTYSGGQFNGSRPANNEERWCDDFALNLLPRAEKLLSIVGR